MRALIAYLSYSGNTEEVAELIENKLLSEGYEVEMHRIGVDSTVDPRLVDLFFLGTFTWSNGSVPEEMKDFILEVGYKPVNIAVFGTGDTQFGGDLLFCRAVDKLVNFYNSQWDGLKIEQSPRGEQENEVFLWVERVICHVKNKHTKSKNVRTGSSK